MSEIERIKDRIRALRQMTEANGCTEAEAKAAAERAMALMARYGLDEIDLSRDQANEPTPSRRRSVVDTLWQVVAEVCRCRGYLQGGGRSGERLVYVYYGAPVDVLVAVYLHELLASAIKRESSDFRRRTEYQARRKPATRSQALRLFQQGLVSRLSQRLRELWWLRINAEGNGLVVKAAEQAHRERLLQELAAKGVVLTSLPSLSRNRGRFSDALLAGWLTGDKIGIDPGVNGGSVGGLLDAPALAESCG